MFKVVYSCQVSNATLCNKSYFDLLIFDISGEITKLIVLDSFVVETLYLFLTMFIFFFLE